MYACLYNDFNLEFIFKKEHLFNAANHISDLTKFTLNVETSEVKVTTLEKAMFCEFPSINLNYKGYQNRYTYMSTYSSSIDTSKNQYYNQIVKYDL